MLKAKRIVLKEHGFLLCCDLLPPWKPLEIRYGVSKNLHWEEAHLPNKDVFHTTGYWINANRRRSLTQEQVAFFSLCLTFSNSSSLKYSSFRAIFMPEPAFISAKSGSASLETVLHLLSLSYLLPGSTAEVPSLKTILALKFKILFAKFPYLSGLHTRRSGYRAEIWLQLLAAWIPWHWYDALIGALY